MTMARVPVNLITGFLGVGKTTAVRHLLAHKPADEYWAVLVNEFGEVGIDGATLDGAADGLKVVEVAGGCICCTTSPMLEVSLARLLQARRPHRLIIEPSGLGHPAGIVDLLREPNLASALDLRNVIVLVDPRNLDDARYTTHPIWRDQLALADVLIGNKCDRADAEQVDRFTALAANLFPRKRAVVTTSRGRFDCALLDLAEQTPAQSPYRPARGREGVARAAVSAGDSQGWRWPAEERFSGDRIAALFQRLARPAELGLPMIVRAKAVLHTDHGWLLFNWVDGETDAIEVAWRRDSRCELIADAAADWQLFHAAISACVIEPVAAR